MAIQTPSFLALRQFVRAEYLSTAIFPPPQQMFRAFDLCPFEQTRVVILGQDPYHGPGQANGLCFSVNDQVPLPPSLQNIFKEIQTDTGHIPQSSGDLSRWAKQGVLLLNATLTVRAHTAGSHQGKGWEEFTDAAIHALAQQREGLVFILWGNFARKKGAFIDRERHKVIESAHPSPLSAYAGFFGSKPFSQTNAYLLSRCEVPIDWS
jgi:uracil-DNA glycosylase